MILSFTHNESLLKRSAIVNHVEDVEESAGVVLNINNVCSDFVIKCTVSDALPSGCEVVVW